MAGGSQIVRRKIFHMNEIKKDGDTLASKEHI